MNSKVEIVGSRIHLVTRDALSAMDRHVPGAYFSARHSRWTFPCTMDACRDLRSYFGEELEIGPDLREWAKAQRALEVAQAELGSALDAVELKRLPRVQPDLFAKLANRPYQTRAAAFVAQGRNVLLADTPGLGKTTEAIAGVVESGVIGPYLVVAPKTSLDVVWEREIRMRLPEATPVVVIGSKAQRAALLGGLVGWDAYADWDEPLSNTWFIINTEMMRTKSFYVCPTCKARWQKSDHPKSSIVDCGHRPDSVETEHDCEYPELFGVEWGAIIMDECHRALLRSSGTPSQQRAGASLLHTRPDGLRIALSGTPMRGKPERLFGVLNWLDRKAYSGYWAWVQRYWDVRREGYAGAMTVGEFRKEKSDQFYTSLNRIMLRRTKAEVTPDLPAKQYMTNAEEGDLTDAIWLPMDPKQEKAYQAMLKSSIAEIEGGRLDAIGVLAQLTRLRQFASSAGRMTFDGFEPALPSNKWMWIVQWLTERNLLAAKDADDAPEGKVVIVSQFTQLLKLIGLELGQLGARSVMLTGEVTGAKRTAAIDTFNDATSGVNIMLLNTTAGGVAVTLDAAEDMILLDETHVPDDQEQVEERINNRNPEVRVLPRRYWYLKSLRSIDEGIARTNAARAAAQREHLDDRRGVAWARDVIDTTRSL